MTYYVTLSSGNVEVIADALAVEEGMPGEPNTIRFLTERGPHTEDLADYPKSEVVGIEQTIADGVTVVVVDAASDHAGERGVVRSIESGNAVQVELDGVGRIFQPAQLGVWSTNRVGRPGHPASAPE